MPHRQNRYSRDANQKRIVKQLEQIGYKVIDLGDYGEGVPDILVGAHGYNILIEIKMPGGELRKSQVDFKAAWPGQADKAEYLKDILKIIEEHVRR